MRRRISSLRLGERGVKDEYAGKDSCIIHVTATAASAWCRHKFQHLLIVLMSAYSQQKNKQNTQNLNSCTKEHTQFTN